MNLLQSAQYLSGVVNGILLTGMKIDYAGGESAIYKVSQKTHFRDLWPLKRTENGP